MRHLLLCGLGVLLVASAVQADEPGGVLGDELRDKFENVELGGFRPEAAPKQPSEEKPAEGLPSTSGLGNYDLPSTDAGVPADVADAVWKMIDENQNGVATDREVFAAIKPLRIVANAKKDVQEINTAVNKAGDENNDDLVSKPEAVILLSKVRAMRCPTAQRAKAYFDRVDKDSSGLIDGPEVNSVLQPLGRVGQYLSQPLAVTLGDIDLDDSKTLTPEEIAYSANAFLRMELATTGDNLPKRNPADWLRIVSAVMRVDGDADNLVSPAEAAHVAVLTRNFKKIDSSRDGKLSASEVCDYQQALDAIAAARRNAALCSS